MEQNRELQDIVAEAERSVALAEPGRHLAEQDQHNVEQDRASNDTEGRNQRQAEPEPEMDDDDRQRLSGDRNPANRDECSQADPAEAGGGLVRGDEAGVAHRMISGAPEILPPPAGER